MNRITLTIFIGLIILSCSNNSEQGYKISNTIKSGLSKKELYLNIMREKNFQLEINGPCDNALEDSIHERLITYIDSKTVTDTNAIIEFRFIDGCCQKFLGDYLIENDTLKFKFEQVNDVVCGCECWYRYKLTINELNENCKYIKIEKKHRLQTQVLN